MIEKLSSDIKRDDRFAGRIAMHGDAFHVVDLIGEIGLEHRPAVDQSPFRLYVGERNATDAEAMPRAGDERRSSSNSSSCERSVQSLTSKSSVRLTPNRVT